MMMKISSGKLQEFECAVSIDKHFVEHPIALTCGHSICKSCIPPHESIIKCNICNKLTKRNIHNDDLNVLSKKAFQLNIHELYSQMEKSFNISLLHLNDNIMNDKNLDAYLNSKRKEISARITALKSELDAIFVQFSNKLNDYKEEFQKRKISIYGDNYEAKQSEFKTCLEKLKEDAKNRSSQTEEIFFGYQNELKKLNKIIANLGSFYNEILFVPSKDVIVADSVGRLLKNDIENKSTKQMLKVPKKIQTLKVDFEPFSLCSLSNGNLLSCNNESLTIFDKNLKVIKTVTKIDKLSLFCFYATTNHKDKIYVSNSEENRVIVTDLELNMIKIIGTHGKSNDQFDHPRGVSYYKSYIYICDYGNIRIQILNEETLEFDKQFPLDYGPVQIKVANDVALIGSLFSLYFHNLTDFSLIRKFDGHNGTISELNSSFYEYFSFNQKFYCYSQSADIIEEIQTDGFNNSEHNGCLVYQHGLYIVPSTEKRKLILIDRLD